MIVVKFKKCYGNDLTWMLSLAYIIGLLPNHAILTQDLILSLRICFKSCVKYFFIVVSENFILYLFLSIDKLNLRYFWRKISFWGLFFNEGTLYFCSWYVNFYLFSCLNDKWQAPLVSEFVKNFRVSSGFCMLAPGAWLWDSGDTATWSCLHT